MSRSGYCDDGDFDNWQMIRWRGAVTSAFKGKRGQAFLREMLAALDALPEKKLISYDLVQPDGCVCALGAVGKARGTDMSRVDPEDHDGVSGLFGVAHAMACEIMFYNDEGSYHYETPEQRFVRMRAWVACQIKEATP